VTTDTGVLPFDDGARPTRPGSSTALTDPPKVLADQVIVDTRSVKVEPDRPRTIPGTVSPDAAEMRVGIEPMTAGAGAMTVDTGPPRTEPDALRVGAHPSSVETEAT
jgi:hypothetical protein